MEGEPTFSLKKRGGLVNVSDVFVVVVMIGGSGDIDMLPLCDRILPMA